MNAKPQNPYQDPNRKGDNKKQKGHIVDPENQLVYEDKHWKDLDNLNPDHIDDIKQGKSPLTKMEEAGLCDGVLHLSGAFLKEHKDEILATAHNSAKLAEERDPMNKIENIEENADDNITIYTLKNQLAVTIGKKIDQSFKGGKLEIVWSKDDQPVEVRWHKD